MSKSWTPKDLRALAGRSDPETASALRSAANSIEIFEEFLPRTGDVLLDIMRRTPGPWRPSLAERFARGLGEGIGGSLVVAGFMLVLVYIALGAS